jgi:Tol biopolymer transport system component
VSLSFSLKLRILTRPSYDISPYGLAFTAKDPTLNQVTTTKSDVYFIPLTTFTETPELKVVLTPGTEGASTAPVFSPNNPSLAFVRQKDISYESDKNRIFTVDITKNLSATE